MRREDYLSVIKNGQDFLNRSFWDEAQGLYREMKVVGNALMLPSLTVLALEGDGESRLKIPRLIERLVQSPPWDSKYHYWNGEWELLGQEPHGGSTQMGTFLALPLRYAGELGLPESLVATGYDYIAKMLTRWVRFTDHAKDAPVTTYVDDKNRPVNLGALKTEYVRQNRPEDFGHLREIGPKNQVCWEMRAAAIMYLTTGREEFWDYTERFWKRIIERVEVGRPYLFLSCFDPDYSYIYSVHPSHRYEMSMYTAHAIGSYADVVRIARKVGRPHPVWEEFLKNWSQAVLTRVILNDGLCNLVLNGYGWERVFLNAVARSQVLHPLISLADLTPLSPEELGYLVDSSVSLYREWEAETNHFPPHLGLKGRSASDPSTSISYLIAELALRLLTNEESIGIEPREPAGCLSSFSWAQKYFVMQTPNYQLTAIGSGTEVRPNEGHQGFGILSSGGEYVIKVPGGEYLTPISDGARTTLEAKVDGDIFSSSEITLDNREQVELKMKVILPNGEEVSRGEDFGPLAYDSRLEKIGLEVRYAKGQAIMGRRFECDSEKIRIKDFLEAKEEIQVEYAFSRLPIITVTAQGETPQIRGLSSGKKIQIKPPCYMGYEIVHDDQFFIESICDLEYLEVGYPSCGMEVRRLDQGKIKLRITRGEWQENKRMRVDGKNLDYVWIYEPMKLLKGQQKSFQYEIRVIRHAEAVTG